MKVNHPIITAITASIITCLQAIGVPAKPGILRLAQPDGTSVSVRISGDEWNHSYTTTDGFPLIAQPDGALYYLTVDNTGTPIASPMAAADSQSRTAEARKWLSQVNAKETLAHQQAAQQMHRKGSARKQPAKSAGLFSETKFPSRGKQKALVILVEYKDVKFTLADPYDYFNRMLNEPGFADYGANGSAADYFRHCSMGQFDPEFVLLGPVTLANDMSFYGGNKANGDDRNPHRMAIEACQQLDAAVDFSEFDRDGDGDIDNVFIFYAGRGEASGGGANTVWPHTWYVSSVEETPYIFDSVRLDRYACSNEWENGLPDGVGTFCHEFSHVLGLPDIYPTATGSTAFTPGDWDLLDHGSYNNNGRTPPAYSSFERYALGWLQPKVLDCPANITLRDIASNSACIIPTPDNDEFFLIENRTQTGWDTYLPGHGMLVWHIHYDSTKWHTNSANNDPEHQNIDLIEADNIPTDETRSDDAFPGSGEVTSFTDETSPAMATWCGAKLNIPITDIAEMGNTVTFKVAGGVPQLPPVANITVSDITPVGFTAAWDAVEGAEAYELTLRSIYTTEGGRPVSSYVYGYSPKNVGSATTHTVTGLNPATGYRLSVAAISEASSGMPSEEVAFTTAEATFQYLSPTACEATDIGPAKFTASWLPLDDATEYQLFAGMELRGEPYTEVADFNGGLQTFAAAGWATDSKMTLSNAAYAGEAIPSLRLSANGSNIDTPVYPQGLRAIEFWHRGISASENNRLMVKALCGNAWQDVASMQVTNEAGGKTTRIDTFPADATSARIVYLMEKGSVAIDDIKTYYGGDVTDRMLTNYAPLQAGNNNSIEVVGLQPQTNYFYYVVAINGEGTESLRSNRVSVQTKAATGVETTTQPQWAVRITGQTLTIEGDGNYMVSDITSRIVASGYSHGQTTIQLPADGIYIVVTPAGACKVATRR